ncbi:MAG: threonine-phosphate decarboxylase [Sedimentitalea sp.]
MSTLIVSNSSNPRDHGGGLDAAIATYGGKRDDWIDLSTGINPVAYPVGSFSPQDWTALPDLNAQTLLNNAARGFWQVPEQAAVLAAPGASTLIAKIPALAPRARVHITQPTYNEHAAAFHAAQWQIVDAPPSEARVLVHPNNPDGRLWSKTDTGAPLTIIDESFCDVAPEASLIKQSAQSGHIVLKSFGKFWGLAGLRLGFAIGDSDLIAQLSAHLGPWPVSGPALRVGATALCDQAWADTTRARLRVDSNRMDEMLIKNGARLVGGTTLFRLYHVQNSAQWQHRLAQSHIWSRIFPYDPHLLRLGLPPDTGWDRLSAAL